MARFNLDKAEFFGGQGGGGFLSFKHRDTARIRILYNSINDVEGYAVHSVELNGKKRYVDCLRGAHEPTRKCPLCRAGYFTEVKYLIPVYDEDIDDIVGMLYVKDLLELVVDEDKREQFSIKKYMREPMFVYENLKCDDLFDEFQKTKVQVAIVLDEYGGTYGLVSMEDLLESIVGDIQDEYDDEEQELQEVNENHFIVDGAALIDDVSKLIGIELDDSENDTIGGLIMDQLGYVPEEDERPSVTIGRALFTIKSMDDRSIDKIDIILNPEESKEY